MNEKWSLPLAYRTSRQAIRPYARATRDPLRGRVTVNELAFGHMMSMSQFGEHALLAEIFRDRPDGFYVDVGALDPFLGSNTHMLFRRGWRGINIETQPDQLALFNKHRPNDVNLATAISQTPGTAQLLLDGSFSGLDTDRHQWRGDNRRPSIEVRVETLASVREQNLPPGTEIDLLDVDCEGHDADVLLSNDWSRFRPQVVLAECHGGAREGEDPTDILLARGYTLMSQLGPTGHLRPNGS